jgi:hypothetical protein
MGQEIPGMLKKRIDNPRQDRDNRGMFLTVTSFVLA